ncbi:hypothetical protein PVOR_05618 [Paenibacillus vortex V453]|uniref:Uncharacterized protein n=1 Tax=Paenibacillus vortex V453 TaxID=715225 RepID=A0A2R9T037_9BACL|nr:MULTISPECIES: hypothetical protein [Paenibacillus]EFU42981.1 hypothetical protein PVOR_05618 [Paenibacillus vortex V453]MDH6671607.1 hypothetical protein [Paenibacillus sp. LBL]
MKKRSLASLSKGMGCSTAVFFDLSEDGISMSIIGYSAIKDPSIRLFE